MLAPVPIYSHATHSVTCHTSTVTTRTNYYSNSYFLTFTTSPNSASLWTTSISHSPLWSPAAPDSFTSTILSGSSMSVCLTPYEILPCTLFWTHPNTNSAFLFRQPASCILSTGYFPWSFKNVRAVWQSWIYGYRRGHRGQLYST